MQSVSLNLQILQHDKQASTRRCKEHTILSDFISQIAPTIQSAREVDDDVWYMISWILHITTRGPRRFS